MRFSLIVATIGRVGELRAYLESLSRQTFDDFEVIIVDQNPDDRLSGLIKTFSKVMSLKWLRLTPQNSSYARNRGLAEATGEIVAFPDDDCLYPDGLLEKVQASYKADPLLAALVGPAVSPAGTLGSGRWHGISGECSMQTIWTSVIEFNLFIKQGWVRRVGGFDEELGVGARYGSGEGVDLAIRIMTLGGKVFYDFDLKVIHPDKALTKTAADRAYRYGTGLGRVLRKHSRETGLPTIFTFAIRPLGGAVISVLKANFLSARYYVQTFRGRATGFTAKL